MKCLSLQLHHNVNPVRRSFVLMAAIFSATYGLCSGQGAPVKVPVKNQLRLKSSL